MRPHQSLRISELSPSLTNGSSEPELTPQESHIVRLVSEGLETKEIARDLFMSERAVQSTLSKIYKKVGVTDRLGLALYAVYLIQAKINQQA